LNPPQQIADRASDAAAAASGALVAGTWVTQTNEMLQLVATVVAILSGIAALAYHVRRWRRERAAHKRETQRAAEEIAKQFAVRGASNDGDGTEN